MSIPGQRLSEPPDLREACGFAGLDHRGAKHLRSQSNEIWHLERAGVVVRLSLHDAVAAAASSMMRLVQWLVDQDLPVAAPWAAFPGPVVLDNGRAATFWRALRVPPVLDYRAFGQLLRRLQDAPPAPASLLLPRLDPVRLASQVLDRAWPHCGVEPAFASARLSELAAHIRHAEWAMPEGLLHGDAHAGNLLVDGSRLVLGDWDSASVGQPEWDLIPNAVETQRWSRPPSNYRDFAEGYGFDVTAWRHYAELRELGEWHVIAERIRIAARVPHAGRNLCRHLQTMRSGDVDAPWYGDEVEIAGRGRPESRHLSSRQG